MCFVFLRCDLPKYFLSFSKYCSNSNIKLFADDTNVFLYGNCVNETNHKAQSVVTELNDWFLANKLSLSIDKTCYSILDVVI